MISLRLFSVALLTLPLLAAADTLFKENFDRLPSGPVDPDAYAGIVPWEGPSAGEFGRMFIVDDVPEAVPSGKDRLHSIALADNSAAPAKAPSLILSWQNKAPASGRLSIAWEFLVPVAEPFLGIQFLGHTWDSSAAAILLQNGEIILHADKGDTARIRVGPYVQGRWHAIKADLDLGARTIDLWLDGKKVVNAVPWLAAAPKTIDHLNTVADFSEEDRAGTPVLYLDNIEVVSSSAK